MSTQEHILQLIREERVRQDDKFGSQRLLSDETWLRILVEEVGEVAESINDHDEKNYPVELVQVAAVAVVALESYYAQRDDTL